MLESMLDWALHYAELGYPVFPCKSGTKVPLTKNGYKDATTNLEQVRKWWTDHPDANIAIATTDLAVFDIDNRDCSWFQDEEIVNALLQAGAISRTPGGGWHVIFRKPKDKQWRCSVGKLAKGVDVRTTGGYIVAPKSKIGDKVYQWLDGYELDVPLQELPEPPAKLIELLDDQSDSKAKTQSAKLTDVEIIPEGQRNDRLFKHACLLRSLGYVQEEIEAALIAINERRCRPALSQSEVKTIAASAARYSPNQVLQEAFKILGNGAWPPACGRQQGVKTESTTDTELVVAYMNTVEKQDIPWLWPGRIPRGTITILVGRPGVGKSFLALDIAARVSAGHVWPDGAPNHNQGRVLLSSLEDDPSYTIRPRLEAQKADTGKIALLQGVKHRGESGQEWIQQITVWHHRLLKTYISSMQDCKLLIIDPVGDFLGAIDANKETEVRQALGPIVELAKESQIAVLLVMHYRKAWGLTADELALGSRAFTALARSVWHVLKDPAQDRVLFLPGKNNLAPQNTGLAFQIAGQPPSLEWEPDPVEMTADDLLTKQALGPKRQRADKGKALALAKNFLQNELASGSQPAKALQDKWREAYGGSVTTLRRAMEELKIEADRPEHLGPWHWRLPGLDDQP